MTSVQASPTVLIPSGGLGTVIMQPTGGIYNITGGTVAGNNLYHGFSTFNLGNGDTANFNVTSNINTILARVTGGPSTIDGTITSTIGAGGPLSNASLFLINPAGVLFTAHAQVTLGGSFVVSSANYVKFDDGSIFWGDLDHATREAGLSVAAVSAFGFMPASGTPRAVNFAGSQITTATGAGLHVISGDITLNGGAALSAPAGRLTLFSAASSGEVPFHLASAGADFATSTVSKFGNITFSQGAQAAIDGTGGGAMVIRGGKVTVDQSYVTSGNFGPVVGGDISVTADQLTISSGGNIATDSFGGANAGGITVQVAGDLNVTGTGSQISADTETAGNAGVVTATVGGTVNLDGGDIFANVSIPQATGSGGVVTVTAGAMNMGGNSRVSTATDGRGAAGAVNLTLTSGPLHMSDSAKIIADTYTSGNGGDITIAAPAVDMTDEALISANSFFSTGRGGDISVQTAALSIRGTGTQPLDSLGITAQSFGAGNAGNVTIDCAQGVLAGASVINASSASTNAGTVKITAADSFALSSGSSINTSAAKNGGNITLRIGRLFYLADSNVEAFAGLSSFAGQRVGGNGGNIDIDPQFVVLDNSLISANDLSGLGQNGNITNFATYFFTSGSLLHATGTVESPSPDLELGDSLVFPPPDLVDAKSQLRERCDRAVNHEFSTFVLVGRGGTESAPEELQPDFGFNSNPAAGDHP